MIFNTFEFISYALETVRCHCRSNPSCINKDDGYKSRCPCAGNKKRCNKKCLCRNCKNKEEELLPATSTSCRCGRWKKSREFVACSNVAGQNQTRCPCFKAGKGCANDCHCFNCQNEFGRHIPLSRTLPSPKRRKRENTKYRPKRTTKYLEENNDELPRGSWSLMEAVGLNCSYKIAQNLDNYTEELVTLIYNTIAMQCKNNKVNIMIREKSERQIKAKLNYINKM